MSVRVPDAPRSLKDGYCKQPGCRDQIGRFSPSEISFGRLDFRCMTAFKIVTTRRVGLGTLFKIT